VKKNSEAPIPHPSVYLDKRRLELIKGYKVHEQRTPAKPVRVATPSQTLGPFFALGLIRPGDDDLACRRAADRGERPRDG
jgi:hypothetical protein